ncbi:MAG: PKD domain-containing protein [Caldilineaceae bacterium]
MTTQRRFFTRPRLWGLLSGLTLRLLLAFAIVLQVGLPEVKPVYADTPGCPLPYGCPPPPTFPAPEILYLSQGGLYGATAAQTASLRNIENQAIDTVLKLHSLPASDADAVRTWGRDDVLAQIYLALVTAIKTSASSRTVDQQNAVDWVTAVAKRRTVSAAVQAAREYVKWAALGRSKFDMLMSSNPTKAQIEAFLSGPVLNYDLPTADATEGWCAYRSPAPYGDEYKGYEVPTCNSRVVGILLPPTPTYEDFVKWGTAKANYPLLSSPAFQTRFSSMTIAFGIALPLGALLGGYLGATGTAMAAAYVAAELAELGAGSTTLIGESATFVIGGMVAISAVTALTIIAALASAIVLGINVTDAANLPGKLATLIETARNTTPDAASLVSSTDGSSNFLSIFVAATSPTPSVESCDNTGMRPGLVELTVINSDTTKLTAFTPCLNPPAIPAASATDTQFVVKTKSTGAEALAPSITVKDATTGKVTSARLIQKWFVATTNGQTVQSLRLDYTDWNNKQQHAWLVGDITIGYTFLLFNSSVSSGSTLSAETCATDGSCAVTQTIQYIGGDGQQYSATLRPYQPPTGTPIVTNGAEGSPLTLKANNFAPGGAVSPVTYQWNFLDSCPMGTCKTLGSTTGETVSYTWQHPGTHLVDLVATDKVGAKATSRLQVTISSVPPTLTFGPTCGGTMTATCNTWQGASGSNQATLRATIGHAGTEDNLRIDVNWGDGTAGTGFVNSGGQSYFGETVLFTTASPVAYTMESVHVYANSGIYAGTVTVRNTLGLDGDGGTVVRPFSIKVGVPPPTNGTVNVWGNNGVGQLNIPVGLSGVIKIAAGLLHTLALKNDSTVVAWGDNTYGQSTVPTGLSGVTAIAAGARHSLALKGDGTVVAWGENSTGQLNIPAGLNNVTAIAAGDFHSLALKNDGTVVAWGSNTTSESTVPAGLNNVTAIGAGWGFSVALKGDGTVVAWGDNTYKQLTVPAGLSGVIRIAAGRLHTLAIRQDNTVVAWGYTCCNQTRVPAGLTNVIAVAGGGYHSLALKSDGTVVSWGDNTQGQRNLPADLSSVAAISAGRLHTVLLSQDGGFQSGVAAAAAVVEQTALTATVPSGLEQVLEEPSGVLPPFDINAPAPTATPAEVAPTQPPAEGTAPTETGQNNRIFLPIITNLAGAALGGPGGIGVLVLVVLVIGGIVWRRRSRTGR